MKKRTKILLPALLAGILCAGAALPLPAEAREGQAVTGYTDNEEQEREVTFDLSVKAEYTVVIPQEAGIEFQDLEHTISVKYAKGNLEPGAAVRVTTSDRMVLKNEKAAGTAAADEQIVFSVSAENAGSEVQSVVFPEGTEAETLKDFTLTTTAEQWNAAKSGNYSGEMVFQISYEDGTGR